MEKKILLVEYDSNTIESIKEVLANPIFKITVAEEGEIAKSILKKENFDLMITEAMLPKFHGFNLSQYVAQNYPHTKIILMSGIYKGYEYKHQALTEYKANDFIEKPLDKNQFKKKIFELLTINEEELAKSKDIDDTQAQVSDTKKIPTIQEKEEDKKLTSEELFGDLIEKAEKIPSYEIDIEKETKKEKEKPTDISRDPSATREMDLSFDELNRVKKVEKDEKKMKKIEDDIARKLEDTLSGLGLESEKISKEPAKIADTPAEKKEIDKKETKDEVEDYEILGLIARGGMAEIYKAKKKGVKGFEKVIALKKILSGFVEDDKYIDMFVDEAKIAAELSHPNIVQILDLGKKDDYYFIAMEYVFGKDLRLIMKRMSEENRLITEAISLYIILKVLEALNYAHSAKDRRSKNLEIVHRDISPPNILISYNGEVKLTDFGVSKASIKMHQTTSGSLKGKILYMSPEQSAGDKHIDHRSDLYSVGVILFELLTGRKLFLDSSEMAIIKKVQKGKIVKPSEINKEISPELENIIMKSLNKDKKKRYQHAGEMIIDIGSYLRKNYQQAAESTHLAHFIFNLFQKEIRKEGIELDLKPISNKITRKIADKEIKEKTQAEPPKEPAKPAIEIDLEKAQIKEFTKPAESPPKFEVKKEKRRTTLVLSIVLAVVIIIALVYFLVIKKPFVLDKPSEKASQINKKSAAIELKKELDLKSKDSLEEIDQNAQPDVIVSPPEQSEDSSENGKSSLSENSKTQANTQDVSAPAEKIEPQQEIPSDKDKTTDVVQKKKTDQTSQKSKEISSKSKKELETPKKVIIYEGMEIPVTETDTRPIPVSTPDIKVSRKIRKSLKSSQKIEVKFLVDHQGKIEKVKLLKKSDVLELNSLIITTLASWQFEPATKNNAKVKVWLQKTININK